MANIKKLLILSVVFAVSLGLQAKKVVDQGFVAEETGLNVTKITDDEMNPVVGPKAVKNCFPSVAKNSIGGSKNGLQQSSSRTLAVSPDGTQIAYFIVE